MHQYDGHLFVIILITWNQQVVYICATKEQVLESYSHVSSNPKSKLARIFIWISHSMTIKVVISLAICNPNHYKSLFKIFSSKWTPFLVGGGGTTFASLHQIAWFLWSWMCPKLRHKFYLDPMSQKIES